jgi:hypothetical protein
MKIVRHTTLKQEWHPRLAYFEAIKKAHPESQMSLIYLNWTVPFTSNFYSDLSIPINSGMELAPSYN